MRKQFLFLFGKSCTILGTDTRISKCAAQTPVHPQQRISLMDGPKNRLDVINNLLRTVFSANISMARLFRGEILENYPSLLY